MVRTTLSVQFLCVGCFFTEEVADVADSASTFRLHVLGSNSHVLVLMLSCRMHPVRLQILQPPRPCRRNGSVTGLIPAGQQRQFRRASNQASGPATFASHDTRQTQRNVPCRFLHPRVGNSCYINATLQAVPTVFCIFLCPWVEGEG
eukprot:2187919-Amphidinium_carterae.1